MRFRKNAVPVPVTRDLLQEKQTEVARLARQASEAVDIVTRTMNELEGINQGTGRDTRHHVPAAEEQYRYHRQLRKAPGYQSRRERE